MNSDTSLVSTILRLTRRRLEPVTTALPFFPASFSPSSLCLVAAKTSSFPPLFLSAQAHSWNGLTHDKSDLIRVSVHKLVQMVLSFSATEISIRAFPSCSISYLPMCAVVHGLRNRITKAVAPEVDLCAGGYFLSQKIDPNLYNRLSHP